MVKYTLKQCQYFKAIAEHGGIAQAARALNLSQPAIAQALNKLESLYAVKLFLRHHAQGVELTPQGREFYTVVCHLLNSAESAERNMHLITSHQKLSIKLGCFHTLSSFCMIPIVRHYKKNREELSIIGQEMLQAELLEKLSNGQLDVGITYDMGLQKSPLKKKHIACLKPQVILSPDHPLAHLKVINAQQLVGLPFIMFDGSGSKEYYQRLLQELGIQPNIALASRNMETVRSAVANNLGFSFTNIRPQTTSTYDGKTVVTRPLAQDCSPLSVVMVLSLAASQSMAIADFIKVCEDLLSGLH